MLQISLKLLILCHGFRYNMKILCSGDRNWGNRLSILRALSSLFTTNPQDVTIIHGGASGADSICDEFAKKLGYNVKEYKPYWRRFGKGAGPIRNQFMIDDNPDIDMAFIFHGNLTESKGTKDMFKRVCRAKIPYKIFSY